jgi:hypothetical protein
LRRKALFVTVRDAAPRQIVRRELERNAVTVHDTNAIPAEFSSHGREDDSAGIDFYREKPRLELFYNLTENLDCVFFWQLFFTFPVSRARQSVVDRPVQSAV